VEWGPIFHRGRLDGSARLLVIGQDPSAHESIARRILIGEAGQRVQGFLAKLGLDTSYVMVNTFLYSVYGQGGGTRHKDDEGIVTYRNRWLDALLLDTAVEAVVAFGGLADDAWSKWSKTQPARAQALAYRHVTHPTEPISASRGNRQKLADETKKMLDGWNAALPVFHAALQHVDTPRPLVPYGDGLVPSDDVEIPEGDLPAGIPPWMRSLKAWAARTGKSADDKRATIEVTVPTDERPWQPHH
jgi:uracil-DNA glycosylase